MKRPLLFVVLTLSINIAFSQGAGKSIISVIPEPVSSVAGIGSFTPPIDITIITSKNDEVKNIAGQLAKKIKIAFGNNVVIKEGNVATSKSFFLSLTSEKLTPKEGYRLKVTDKGVHLTASDPAGIFWGVQTLYQLMPRQIFSKKQVSLRGWNIPSVTIEDHPRFGWRGLLLDVSRHFFTVEQVKEFIDEMVMFKYNLLHFHLTDDQGWRLEIKSFPKLTEVGAWRAPRAGIWSKVVEPTPDEPRTYGGFYTQEEIKTLIIYAKERYVTILPEIDVPGHSLAAIASYPELTCKTDSITTIPGSLLQITPSNGPPHPSVNNILCPANEKVYEFLDKVFTEVAQLFPFEYIHMGGDECNKGHWGKSEMCKQLMQKEGLKDVFELQSYFVKRVEKILRSKGKKLIGWDEIMQGGLANSASVMSWRGMNSGIAAAKAKHHVVMSPDEYTYVDLCQGDPIAEPPSYAFLRLNKAYQFDPLPPGIDSTYILGGQCNLWTEQVNSMRQAQYMLWPRALATAESIWSPKEKKNWADFVRRVEIQFRRFDIAEIKYSRSLYDPIFTTKRNSNGQLEIQLSTEVEGLTIHFTFDEEFPDNFYPAYSNPLSIPKVASNLTVVTYRGKEQMGKIIKMPVAELKSRAGMR
jgi:hexosaminidase